MLLIAFLLSILIEPIVSADTAPIGWVVSVDGDRVVTNVGSDLHLTPGTKLRIYRMEEVTHPKTDVVLSTVRIDIAEATVIKVAKNQSIARLTGAAGPIQPLDLIEIIQWVEDTRQTHSLRDMWLPASLALLSGSLAIYYHHQGNVSYVRYLRAPEAQEAADLRRDTNRNDRIRNIFAVGTTFALSLALRHVVWK